MSCLVKFFPRSWTVDKFPGDVTVQLIAINKTGMLVIMCLLTIDAELN